MNTITADYTEKLTDPSAGLSDERWIWSGLKG